MFQLETFQFQMSPLAILGTRNAGLLNQGIRMKLSLTNQPAVTDICFLVSNLFNSYPELPSPQVVTYCELLSRRSFPPTSQSSVSHTIQVSSEPSKSSSGVLEKQCKKCSVTNRSCTKVIFFNCFYNIQGKRKLIELHLLNLHNKSSDCGLATSHSSRFLHL